ncbi:MAG TPA: hypothetical protein VFV86_09430 [Nitrososphaeraceae archaeon]|nr:hypothetical protein [Nitrososphaeraceae archaeon]
MTYLFGFKENPYYRDKERLIGTEIGITTALELKKEFESIKNNWLYI